MFTSPVYFLTKIGTGWGETVFKIFANHTSHKVLISEINKKRIQLKTKTKTTKTKQSDKRIVKDLSRYMFHRRHRDGQQKHGRIFYLLISREIKTTVNYHLTPVTMVIIKKTRNNKCSQE